jgi:uncharacterized protein with von Willebrand factor type A (vWA) domain
MNFKINRKRLYEACKKAIRAAAPESMSNIAPETAGILLEADSSKETLKLYCTDLKVSIMFSLKDVDVAVSGETVVSATLFTQILANYDVLSKVRRNPKLLEISRIMGRYIKMIAEKRKNSFEYGLGQKYDISLGKNLNLCLSSEMALLRTPETQPLFMKKYMEGKLKQYRKREPEVKGQGDIIVCVDESLSMNDNNYILWAKALAFALLDIATKGKRKFAMVRFCERAETHLFLPNEYTSQDLITAIEGFMRGGTNFEKPLTEACRLINENGFENADVIFITDGICAISNDFAEYFKQQKAGGFNVRGILLGYDAGGSLEQFCDKVYRLSDLGLDEIAQQIISDKI